MSAASVATSRMLALPVSRLRKSRTGAARFRAQAVFPLYSLVSAVAIAGDYHDPEFSARRRPHDPPRVRVATTTVARSRRAQREVIMYRQVLDPVSHSLGLTSIFAVLPLVVLFVLLGVLRMKAQWASLITLVVSIVVALAVYSMPIGQAGDAALEGVVFGLWPIMWIVINALWIFKMTEASGHFKLLRRAFATVSDDIRVQVVVIAFCFGALLEALAGFGTPVAICGIMLVGLGVKPVKAAAVALVADTAPVAFGAIAIPLPPRA